MGVPRRKIHEVLVVGSGASGGWVAKEVTERGLSVAMLEAGPPRVPTRDFTEHVWPYQLKFRGFGDQQQLLRTQPVQRLCYACDEYSHQFFVNDLETRIRSLQINHSFGFAAARLEERHSAGLAKAIGTVTTSSKRPVATVT